MVMPRVIMIEVSALAEMVVLIANQRLMTMLTTIVMLMRGCSNNGDVDCVERRALEYRCTRYMFVNLVHWWIHI